MTDWLNLVFSSVALGLWAAALYMWWLNNKTVTQLEWAVRQLEDVVYGRRP